MCEMGHARGDAARDRARNVNRFARPVRLGGVSLRLVVLLASFAFLSGSARAFDRPEAVEIRFPADCDAWAWAAVRAQLELELGETRLSEEGPLTLRIEPIACEPSSAVVVHVTDRATGHTRERAIAPASARELSLTLVEVALEEWERFRRAADEEREARAREAAQNERVDALSDELVVVREALQESRRETASAIRSVEEAVQAVEAREEAREAEARRLRGSALAASYEGRFFGRELLSGASLTGAFAVSWLRLQFDAFVLAGETDVPDRGSVRWRVGGGGVGVSACHRVGREGPTLSLGPVLSAAFVRAQGRNPSPGIVVRSGDGPLVSVALRAELLATLFSPVGLRVSVEVGHVLLGFDAADVSGVVASLSGAFVAMGLGVVVGS